MEVSFSSSIFDCFSDILKNVSILTFSEKVFGNPGDIDVNFLCLCMSKSSPTFIFGRTLLMEKTKKMATFPKPTIR